MNAQPSRAVETPYHMFVVSHIHRSLHQNRRGQVQTIILTQRCIAIGILLSAQLHHLSSAQIWNRPPRGHVLVIDAGRALPGQGHRRLDRSRRRRRPSPPRLGRRRTRGRRPSRYPAHSRRIIKIFIHKISRFRHLLLLLLLHPGRLPSCIIQRHDSILLSYLLLVCIWSHYGLGITFADPITIVATSIKGIPTTAIRPYIIGMRRRWGNASKRTGVRCSGCGDIKSIISTTTATRSRPP